MSIHSRIPTRAGLVSADAGRHSIRAIGFRGQRRGVGMNEVRSKAAQEAMDVAEASRETEWEKPSFVGRMFLESSIST